MSHERAALQHNNVSSSSRDARSAECYKCLVPALAGMNYSRKWTFQTEFIGL